MGRSVNQPFLRYYSFFEKEINEFDNNDEEEDTTIDTRMYKSERERISLE